MGRQEALKKSIDALSAKLSAPQRAHEAYKAAVKRWEDARGTLVGTPDQLGSLSQLKEALTRIPALKEREKALRQEQSNKATEIYREKEKLRDDYGRYYGAVQGFLAEHPLAQSQQFKLTFNVAITQQGFANTFLKLLNQRRLGTFAGVEDGAERLKLQLESTNFEDLGETSGFLDRIMAALREDQREGKTRGTVELKDQLAQGVSITDVYDYIFGLTYLDPVYNLRWDGKTLEQLSPGERGNLLLIFYLLIDRDNIPLVIDQPEENLDNNTVYRTLVPCVKEAKQRRQIVIVTHNPNLAVVCDAEQIICAEIQKENGNRVVYTSGSIEDPVINKKILDVLEGVTSRFNQNSSSQDT